MAALRPQTAYERKAALHRRARLADFSGWLADNSGLSLKDVIASAEVSAENVNNFLTRSVVAGHMATFRSS